MKTVKSAARLALLVVVVFLVVVSMLVCITDSSHAAEPGFKAASIAFGAGVFADAWTSERGFDAGYLESNPTLPARPTDSRFFAQLVICDGAVYWFAWRLRHSHPAAARWILIGGALVHAAAAAHNDRLFDSEPGR